MPGTVNVACKLPHGLRLQLQRPFQVTETTMGGNKEVTQYRPHGEVVVLKGASHAVDKWPEYQIIGGFAITPNVDADFFTEWMKQNADHPAVSGGFIFASSKMADVTAHTDAGKDVMSGLEPINPNRLPAEFAGKIKAA